MLHDFVMHLAKVDRQREDPHQLKGVFHSISEPNASEFVGRKRILFCADEACEARDHLMI